MANSNLLIKLGGMLGKQWMYNTVIYKFHSVSTDDDGYPVRLHTDKKTLELINENALKLFMQDCLEVEQEEERAVVSVQDHQSLEMMTSLTDVIMDNIERVREDKEYIQQATTISKQVQTLINLTNMQLQLHKNVNKL